MNPEKFSGIAAIWSARFPAGPIRYLVPSPLALENRRLDEAEVLQNALWGDTAAALRYGERMLDLDRRFDRWQRSA
jgi:hypothetical protein